MDTLIILCQYSSASTVQTNIEVNNMIYLNILSYILFC